MKELISKLFLFENTDFEAIYKKYSISETVEVTSCPKDSVILSSETEQKGIFLMAKGRATIYSGSSGHKTVLRNLNQGDIFGAASLFDGVKLYNTTVISGECEIILLPKKLIQEIIRYESEVAFNYLRYLSDRVSFLNKKISAFTAGSAEQKLAVYLSGLDFKDGRCTIEVSYTSLAQMLGIGRASLYRSLELFENEGIISRNGKTIVLTDEASLEKYI